MHGGSFYKFILQKSFSIKHRIELANENSGKMMEEL